MHRSWGPLALIAVLGCGGDDAAAPDAAPAPSGHELMTRHCTRGCHGLDWIAPVRQDAAGWRVTVDRMVRYGLVVTAADATAIIDYLAITYPP